MSYITKKPEKLASAIYLITSFFPDQEPLKWRLRAITSELVSISLYLKDNFVRERETAALELRAIVIEVTALLTVARNSGLVSDDNGEIIVREFHKYLNSLGLPTGTAEEEGRILVTPSFFNIDSSPKKAELSTAEKGEKDKSSESTSSVVSNLPKRPTQDEGLSGTREEVGYLPEVRNIGHTRAEKVNKPLNLKAFGAVSVKKSARRNIIINLLKRKKEIMIKDISPLIKGCSEKTIQRELLAMVKAGVLKKEGERRWSKYRLA